MYSLQVLLPAFPPIFHRWFLDKFPSPVTWIAARNKYTRTVGALYASMRPSMKKTLLWPKF